MRRESQRSGDSCAKRCTARGLGSGEMRASERWSSRRRRPQLRPRAQRNRRPSSNSHNSNKQTRRRAGEPRREAAVAGERGGAAAAERRRRDEEQRPINSAEEQEELDPSLFHSFALSLLLLRLCGFCASLLASLLVVGCWLGPRRCCCRLVVSSSCPRRRRCADLIVAAFSRSSIRCLLLALSRHRSRRPPC